MLTATPRPHTVFSRTSRHLPSSLAALATCVVMVAAHLPAQETAPQATVAAAPALPPVASPAAWKVADSARIAIEAAVGEANPDGIAAARVIAERGLAPYPDDPILLHYVGYALLREGLMREDAEPQRARALVLQARTTLERSAVGREMPETTG